MNHADPAIVANTVICLIHQANYLLDHQIGALERDFIHEGGYSEQLAAARIAERQRRSDEADSPDRFPVCPLCGKLMALRTARKGKNAGSQFWGCTAYPTCKGTWPLEGGDNRTDRTDWSDKKPRATALPATGTSDTRPRPGCRSARFPYGLDARARA